MSDLLRLSARAMRAFGYMRYGNNIVHGLEICIQIVNGKNRMASDIQQILTLNSEHTSADGENWQHQMNQ